MIGWIVIIVGVVAGGIGELAVRRRLRKFWQRGCAGRLWRREFPEASAGEIREFLSVFVEAFGISQKHRLTLRPGDEVMEVYRAINPKWAAIDNLELETFAMELEEKYGLKLERVWRDCLGLAEVFREARARARGL